MSLGLATPSDGIKDKVDEETRKRKKQQKATGVEPAVGQASVFSILGMQ